MKPTVKSTRLAADGSKISEVELTPEEFARTTKVGDVSQYWRKDGTTGYNRVTAVYPEQLQAEFEEITPEEALQAG